MQEREGGFQNSGWRKRGHRWDKIRTVKYYNALEALRILSNSLYKIYQFLQVTFFW
jgi:hypothetical protein